MYKFVCIPLSILKFNLVRKRVTQLKIKLQQFPPTDGNRLEFFVQTYVLRADFYRCHICDYNLIQVKLRLKLLKYYF